MKKLGFKVIVVSLMVAASSCKTSKEVVVATETVVEQPTQPTPAIVPPKAVLAETFPAQLSGKTWQLVWMVTADVAQVDYQGQMPFVTFNNEKSTINGNSGCNNFGGNTELGPNTIKVGMLFSTKKFCDGIPEPEFLRGLESCKKYEVVNDMLILYNETDQIVMKLSVSGK